MSETGIPFLQKEIEAKLNHLRSQALHRSVNRQKAAGSIDLSHNDYLALGDDKPFQRKLLQSIRNRPMAGRSSRLLKSDGDSYQELEEMFAVFKGTESALYFSSGYAANESLIAALSFRRVRIFVDELVHASVWDGLRQSPVPRAYKCKFSHNKIEELEEKLRASDASLNIVLVESLYSMDGDLAPLPELMELVERYQGLLVVDEAHSLGCLGLGGVGLVKSPHVISVNPCGKGFGGQGAFIACPAWFKDYLVNTSRRFIYSTASSPWLIEGLKQTLGYITHLDERREHLADLGVKVRRSLKDLGFDIGSSQSHIIPVIIGDEGRTLDVASHLLERGIVVSAVRPPTVAKGRSRLRLSLNAGLSNEQVDQVLEEFKGLKRGVEG